MSGKVEGSLNTGIPGEPPSRQDDIKMDTSKARDEFLGIQSDDFYSYEQFGVSARYTERFSKESWGKCWGRCYMRIYAVFDEMASELKHRPADQDVLSRLDAGHAAFYATLYRVKGQGLLEEVRVDEALPLWSEYFAQWEGWFRAHYPKDFWADAESEAYLWSLLDDL